MMCASLAFFNVANLLVTVVVDSDVFSNLCYTRPAGLYWDIHVEKGLITGLETLLDQLWTQFC